MWREIRRKQGKFDREMGSHSADILVTAFHRDRIENAMNGLTAYDCLDFCAHR
jgi:hypothetical protein